MKVSLDWLNQLVDLNVTPQELANLISLKIQGGVKELTGDYIELDLKGYNRADLLSLRGVAHEVAAITDSKVKFTEHTEQEEEILQEVSLSKLDIKIADTNLCPVYCLAKIEGLKVETSSSDWIKKLHDSGIRSVNNIADVTNLVMLEYGQPLHAFDAEKVLDQRIIVRSAQEGEKLQTLDNKTRNLNPQDLLITDSEKILGLAGIMGGKDSEITDLTSTILLEAAIFDPIALRKTATRMSLHSEASKRFQHGLTKKRLLQAFSSAIKIYQSMGGRLTGIIVLDHLTTTYPIISLSLDKVNSLIGIELSAEQIEHYLHKLSFKVEKNIEGWDVTPPYYRLDLQIEEDVIEEIARIYGYDKITAKPLSGDIPEAIDQTFYSKVSELRDRISKEGFNEVQTYSFISQEVINATGKDRLQLIKLENPMSSQTQYLRDELWPNLLEVVSKNLKHGINPLAVFEIGKVYQIDNQGNPSERYKLAAAFVDSSDNPAASLNKLLEETLKHFGLKFKTFKNLNSVFHPVRQMSIEKENGEAVGVLAEVHLRVTDKLGINQRVAILEVEL